MVFSHRPNLLKCLATLFLFGSLAFAETVPLQQGQWLVLPFSKIKPNQVSFNEVNLQTVQAAVDAKKLDTKAAVTAATLIAAGVISRPLGGVRLLAKGEIKSKLAFEVFYATKGAIAAVEKAGGSVKVLRPVEVPSEHKK